MEVNPIAPVIIEEPKKIIRESDKCKEGEMIMIFESKDSIKCVVLHKNEVFNNKFGSFPHSSIIGQQYGSRITCSRNKGFIYVLKFTPYLWEKSMNRYTQILFNADISFILTLLNINKHSIIYESGTGSGCLSVNMLQNIEFGHLYTFEFNFERATKLKERFIQLGLEKKVTITHRDVVANGFELPLESLSNEGHKVCDSIFIDLPSPWLIIPFAKKVLSKEGVFVSFSPCIEQIHETAKGLKENGFFNTKMYEVLYRNFNYQRTLKVEIPDFTVKRKSGEDITFKEHDLLTCNSKADMRGHTGYLLVSYNL